jgi:hypothetical protein
MDIENVVDTTGAIVKPSDDDKKKEAVKHLGDPRW